MKKNLGISIFLTLFSFFKIKSKQPDLRKMEFTGSTQKMGVSFTDRIRDAFRHKWIKKNPN
jgi:hypothetical protein